MDAGVGSGSGAGANTGAGANKSAWIQTMMTFVQKELHEHHVYESLVLPLVKRILWVLLPYGLCFLLLNFFTTLLASGMVVYVSRRYSQ